MDGFSALIKNIHWDTLPPWAVIAAIIIFVSGICLWSWISQSKKVETKVDIGDGNEGLDADVSKNSEVKVGSKNKGIKLKIGGKR